MLLYMGLTRNRSQGVPGLVRLRFKIVKVFYPGVKTGSWLTKKNQSIRLSHIEDHLNKLNVHKINI